MWPVASHAMGHFGNPHARLRSVRQAWGCAAGSVCQIRLHIFPAVCVCVRSWEIVRQIGNTQPGHPAHFAVTAYL